MCNCKTQDFGQNSSVNQEVVETPYFIKDYFKDDPCSSDKSRICIDKCLVEEIKELWSYGIITTGCCCGHNSELPPYIGVITAHIPVMKKLGYRVHYSPCRPGDEDSFYPKTVKYMRTKCDACGDVLVMCENCETTICPTCGDMSEWVQDSDGVDICPDCYAELKNCEDFYAEDEDDD